MQQGMHKSAGNRSMIDSGSATSGPILAQIVFPSAAAALTPRPLNHFRSVVLLRLAGGTLWMMSAPQCVWSMRRLLSAATLLGAGAASTTTREQLQARVRDSLDCSALRLEHPRLDTVDADQWGIHEVAEALAARDGALEAGPLRGVPSPRSRSRWIEAALNEQLDDTLRSFVHDLNASALAAATVDGRVDVLLYNYLAANDVGSRRRQFANDFPGLLRLAAGADTSGCGAQLRDIVDRGEPLIKGMARRWGVRRGVIRQLAHKPAALVGGRWAARPDQLAVLLDALHHGELPGNDPDHWTRFNRAVDYGETLFGKPLVGSPAALTWLRDCFHHTRDSSSRALRHWYPDHRSRMTLQQLRALLVAALRRDGGAASAAGEQQLARAADQAVDELLARSARSGLGKLATRFDNARARTRAESREASEVARRDALWPLIPGDFHSSDGLRLVHALTSRRQLIEQGRALQQCLGSGYAGHYLNKGEAGSNFIVGLFDTSDGSPCSTAEIAVVDGPTTLAYRLEVVQHSAHDNTAPSQPCQQALEELLNHCKTRQVRRHLSTGWRLIFEMSRPRARRSGVRLDAGGDIALKRTIGERAYRQLLETVTGGRERT